MMRRSKYAVLFLSLFVVGLAMRAMPAAAEVKTVEATFVEAYENGTVLVRLPGGREMILNVAEDSRFIDARKNQIDFDKFAENYQSRKIKLTFRAD